MLIVTCEKRIQLQIIRKRRRTKRCLCCKVKWPVGTTLGALLILQTTFASANNNVMNGEGDGNMQFWEEKSRNYVSSQNTLLITAWFYGLNNSTKRFAMKRMPDWSLSHSPSLFVASKALELFLSKIKWTMNRLRDWARLNEIYNFEMASWWCLDTTK